jgi:excisionase family DNA binding protein
MKPRHIQFGARKNTASSRQHDLRLVASSFPLQSQKLSGNVNDEEHSTPPASPVVGTLAASVAEPTNEATRDEVIVSKKLPITKRDGNQESMSVPLTSEKGLVNVHAAARFLGVSVPTLYGWVWQRRISFVKVGRAVRFDMADLRKFIEENRIHARTPGKL